MKKSPDHITIENDLAGTPPEVWKALYQGMDFIKERTMDPFEYNEVFNRLHFFCGWKRKLAPRDLYFNPPFSNQQAALAIRKALLMFFLGSNVALLIPQESLDSS